MSRIWRSAKIVLIAIAILAATLIVTFFLEPGMNPPGFTGRGAYAMVIVFAGSFFLAGKCRRGEVFLVLGGLGAMFLLPEYSGQGWWRFYGTSRIDLYASLIAWSVYVTLAALLARMIATIRWRLVQEVPRDNPACRHCGYDLRAAENRCPECGNTFNFDDKTTFLATRRYWDFRWLVRRCGIVIAFIFLPLIAVYAVLYWYSDGHAIARVEALGGQVDTESALPASLVYWPPALPIGPLKELFDHATIVVWRGSPVSDDDLACLQSLSQLTEIHIDNAPLSGKGFSGLVHLSHLEHLYLPGSNIDDAGLVSIGKLTALTQLQLTGTRVTDTGLPCLLNLSKLEYLWLEKTRVSADGVMNLQHLPALRGLSLTHSRLIQDGIHKLTALRPEINVNGPDK